MREMAFRVTRRLAEEASTPRTRRRQGAKQAEGEDGDGDAENGQAGAELVAEGIPKEQLKDEHRSRQPFPGA